MELSRQEYPALLTSLQPAQAVAVLNERVQNIEQLNQDIASWITERRAIEDAYVQGLRQLAGHKLSSNQLGVFQIPWQSLLSTCESLAESHSILSQRIDSDVEKPLREYSTKNSEINEIKTVRNNITAVAKKVDEAQKKSDKILSKGNKADSAKLSSALSGIQEAQQQWESQAPYVFEQLQALDEQRINHLRDVLTQLQTHESDQLERSRGVVASSLETILNVNTNEEISSFVARNTNATPSLPPTTPLQQRRMSRLSVGSTSRPPRTASSDAPPVPEMPQALSNQATSQRRGSTPSATESRDQPAAEIPTPKKSSMGGLRRLGTVMRRGKDSKSTPGPSSKPRASRNPLKRGTSNRDTMLQLGSPNQSMSELAHRSSTGLSQTTGRTPAAADQATNGTHAEGSSGAAGVAIGAAAGAATEGLIASSQTNGSAHQNDAQEKPPEPGASVESGKEPERPGSIVDEITRAQQEAAAYGEADQPQLNVNIRHEPIPEESDDAEKAISDTANMLRQGAQPPQRKVGTVRGRRDVRNTMFVPSNVAADLANISSPSLASPPVDGVRTNTLPSLSPLGAGKMEDSQSSTETQSIRSARSLASMGATPVRHPDLTAAGLSASIVETISATLLNGQVAKVTAIGEMALAYNSTERAGGEHGEESEAAEGPGEEGGGEGVPNSAIIRLDNFQVLEKVAPNPGFVTPIEGKAGEYSIVPAQIGRQQVGFKYQVHLDESNLASYAPVLLTPLWKVEPAQISVILNYAPNPAFAGGAASGGGSSEAKRTTTLLQNAVLLIGIEGAKAISCLSKPSGTFSKEKGLLFWRLGDVLLEPGAAGGKLLARFSTEGQAAPGAVEARWEITGDHAAPVVGSGLGLSLAAHQNPFDDGQAVPYAPVSVLRKLASGKYVAA